MYRDIWSLNPKFQNFISRIDRLPAFSINRKIYIVKLPRNWPKLQIFLKMGVTFDWNVLCRWNFHCCASLFSALLLKKQNVLRKKNFQRHLTTPKIDLEINLWQMLRPWKMYLICSSPFLYFGLSLINR